MMAAENKAVSTHGASAAKGWTNTLSWATDAEAPSRGNSESAPAASSDLKSLGPARDRYKFIHDDFNFII